MKTVAIIGLGCAGFSAAKAVREADPKRSIHIYSDTDEAPYNPMLTTYYASGKIREDEMFPLGNLEDISRELNAKIMCLSPVVSLRAQTREIVLENGNIECYDDIIIASGASAVVPPIKNLPSRGIYTMRTASDARRLERVLESGVKRAIVVGAQMVGIKVVELLMKRGIKTLLVDMETQMFPASAYETTASIITDKLMGKGVELKLGTAIRTVEECENGLCSGFSDGSSAESDIVVFCSGIRPNIGFVDKNEIEVGVGIKTDLHMQSNVPHIYAAGDCCETLNVLTGKNAYIGLWANSMMQGRIAGNNVVGKREKYQGNLIHNITHYMDTDFISVGDIKSEGKRIFWEKPDGSWRLEATMLDGKMRALNILDNANIAGPVKAVLVHQAAHPDETMSGATKLLLARNGIPAKIIAQLGGM